MYCTSTNDYILKQAGLIQNSDINTGIHDSFLRTATLIQATKDYRPIWFYWKRIRPIRWATGMFPKLSFSGRQTIRKQIQKNYHSASTLPGN
jgi:hypothetical protein